LKWTFELRHIQALIRNLQGEGSGKVASDRIRESAAAPAYLLGPLVEQEFRRACRIP
jgi:hypothetical protein